MTDLTEKKVYDIHGEVCAVRAIVERIEKDLHERPCIEHGKEIEGLKVKSGFISAIVGTVFGGTVSWFVSHLK